MYNLPVSVTIHNRYIKLIKYNLLSIIIQFRLLSLDYLL